MSTEQLSMSMFATRADYDAAVRAQAEQLPDGLQLAIELIEPESEDAACDRWVESERPHGDAEAVQRQWEESRQLRWVRQANRAAAAIHATHMAHAAALARIAELEAERDAMRAKLAEIEVQRLAELSAQKLAVRAAVSAIYFADSADYPGALWDVVRALRPDLAELLGRDDRAAWLAVQDEPEQAKPADGCGACRDACRSRGSCRLANESPEAAR